MAKRRNLKGIPHNITKSFFSTIRYYGCGYMGDWLLNGARRLNLTEATLDVLSVKIYPKELEVYPLLFHLEDLRSIIIKETVRNGFDPDYIKTALINIKFLDPIKYRRTFYCFPVLTSQDGHEFQCGRIIEQAYEEDFDPFNKKNLNPSHRNKGSLIEKLLSFFRKT